MGSILTDIASEPVIPPSFDRSRQIVTPLKTQKPLIPVADEIVRLHRILGYTLRHSEYGTTHGKTFGATSILWGERALAEIRVGEKGLVYEFAPLRGQEVPHEEYAAIMKAMEKVL